MNKLKSIWTTLTGSISAIIPLFFAACKGGACATVCISPIASLFGVSSATLVTSPLMQSLMPLLLVISALAFTISYYKLYVLPKYDIVSSCTTDCACDAPKKPLHKTFPFWSFWIGLVVSIFLFTSFEVQNYKSNTEDVKASCSTEQIVPADRNVGTSCCSDNTKCE